MRQAETQKKAAEDAVTARLPETYQWLLVPTQANPQAAVVWQAIRLSGQEAPAVRASKKLRNDELLVTSFGATRLRLEMDRVLPVARRLRCHQTAVDDFGRYLYLPRLKDAAVLAGAIRDGCALLTWAQDAFAYAESYDEAAQRYRGLRYGQHIAITDGDTGLLVHPEVARRRSTRRPQRPSLSASTLSQHRHQDRDRLSHRPDLSYRPAPNAFTARSRSIQNGPGVMQVRSPTRSSRTLSGSSGLRCG